MDDREAQIGGLLSGSGWENARRSPLAGDASSRRYFRLSAKGRTAILMDAGAAQKDSVVSFVRIGNWLKGKGLSAPEILLSDTANGLLLLEDLGDDLFARILQNRTNMEPGLYEAATDVLLDLHQHRPPDGLRRFSPALMAEQTMLIYDWYVRAGGRPFAEQAARFQPAFEELLTAQCGECDVMIHRDYHAENLIWLPERSGTARVGLIDFQDAMTGHRAYDLVSMLQDARRDVSPETEAAMIERYLNQSGLDPQAFRAAYAVLGTQRNLRILGIFARLSLHFGKPHYVDFIPRVWGYVVRNLEHSALSGIRTTLIDDLPKPDKAFLKRLKDQCATIPML